MTATTQDAQKRWYAGSYLLAKTRTRFWGWRKKKTAHATIAETEQSWITLAEWLRLAHAQLDSKAVEPPRQSIPLDNSAKSDSPRADSPPSQTAKLRRFVS